MQFHDYETSWEILKKAGLSNNFRDEAHMQSFVTDITIKAGDPFAYRHGEIEKQWRELGRPYYSVWPAITPLLLNMTLEIPCNLIKFPMDALLLRLPKENNPLPNIKSVLMGCQEVAKEVGSKELVRGMVLAIDIGEKLPGSQLPVFTLRIFPLREDMNVEQALCTLAIHPSSGMGLKLSDEEIISCVRLAVCVCVIGSDPEIVRPDVLAKDRDKFNTADETAKQVIVDRAIRRGKFGFNFGAIFETSPHYRRTHPALYWTGEGRTIPKIIWRKATIVKRQKITSIPTGKKDE